MWSGYSEQGLRQYVILDIGGERFQGCRGHFIKYPKTRLGRLMNTDNGDDWEWVGNNGGWRWKSPANAVSEKEPHRICTVVERVKGENFNDDDSGFLKP